MLGPYFKVLKGYKYAGMNDTVVWQDHVLDIASINFKVEVIVIDGYNFSYIQLAATS